MCSKAVVGALLGLYTWPKSRDNTSGQRIEK